MPCSGAQRAKRRHSHADDRTSWRLQKELLFYLALVLTLGLLCSPGQLQIVQCDTLCAPIAGLSKDGDCLTKNTYSVVELVSFDQRAAQVIRAAP